MNKLVEYLDKHHNPEGNSINHVYVDLIVKETGWSREEIWELAKDTEAQNQLSRAYMRKDNDHSRRTTAEDLFTVDIWNRIYWK